MKELFCVFRPLQRVLKCGRWLRVALIGLVVPCAIADFTNPAWELRHTVSPSCRVGHAMVYDSDRSRVVFYGGIDWVHGWQTDTWEWDGTSWTKAAVTGPPGRIWHAMAYDAARRRVVLFGGHISGALLGDTWEWDGATWTQIATTGPTPRYDHAMVYDAARARVVLFGGGTTGGFASNETWEWDGASWTLCSPAASPGHRFTHEMAYDSARERVVLFGGRSGILNFNDTWEWDGTAWTLRSESGGPHGPPLSRHHAMTYDSKRQRVVLFGGILGVYPYNYYLEDTWEWDGKTWSQRATNGPPAPRAWTGLAYDTARERVVLFGGGNPDICWGDTWELPSGVCEGDANGDRIVDFVDLNLVLTYFGQSGPNLPGDFDGDGDVDFVDLNVLLANFGTGC